MVVYIPPELSDYIIDFLYDDPATLMACSTTSRTWYPAARYHLFWKVSLPDFNSCVMYCKLLQSSPMLGSFTRDVKISNAFPTSARKSFGNDSWKELGRLWASILPTLTTVKHLELSFVTAQSVLINNLIQNLNTVTVISLQYCRFESFSDFAAVLCSFPALRSCVLRGISWYNAITPATTITGGAKPLSARLAELTLGRDLPLEELSQWLVAEDACGSLVRFSGSCSSERDAQLLSELLQTASATLTDIELDWYSASYTDIRLPFDFTLGSCHSLESLALRCPVALNSTVPWVDSLLEQANPARLKALHLEVRLLGSLEALNWARLDSRFSQEEFVQLSSVDVKVLVWHTAADFPDGVTQAIQRRLPLLHEKGMLHTHCR